MCCISKITVPMSVSVPTLIGHPRTLHPWFSIAILSPLPRGKRLGLSAVHSCHWGAQWTRASKTVPSQGAAGVNPWVVLMCSKCQAELWVCKCSSSSLCSSPSLFPCLLARKPSVVWGAKPAQGLGEQWPKNRLQLVNQNLPLGCYLKEIRENSYANRNLDFSHTHTLL